MASRLTNLRVDFGSLVDDGANQHAHIALWKRAKPCDEEAEMPEEKKKDKQAKAAETAPETTVTETPATEEVTTTTAETAPAATEKKSSAKQDEAVTKQLADLEKRLEESNARAAKAEEIAKAERDQRVTAEYVEKAKTFVALPIKAADFGPVLKRAAESLSKEDCAEIDRVLRAADEQIKASKLFAEVGKSGVNAEGSAAAEINKRAEELRKQTPSLSIQAARVEVRRANPELRQREREEQATRH